MVDVLSRARRDVVCKRHGQSEKRCKWVVGQSYSQPLTLNPQPSHLSTVVPSHQPSYIPCLQGVCSSTCPQLKRHNTTQVKKEKRGKPTRAPPTPTTLPGPAIQDTHRSQVPVSLFSTPALLMSHTTQLSAIHQLINPRPTFIHIHTHPWTPQADEKPDVRRR